MNTGKKRDFHHRSYGKSHVQENTRAPRLGLSRGPLMEPSFDLDKHKIIRRILFFYRYYYYFWFDIQHFQDGVHGPFNSVKPLSARVCL